MTTHALPQPLNDGTQPIAVSYSHHDGRDAIAFWIRSRPGANMLPIFISSDQALQLVRGLHEAIGGETDPRIVNDGDFPRLQVGYDAENSAVSVDVQFQPDGMWAAILMVDAAAYELARSTGQIIVDRDRDPRRIAEIRRLHPDDFV